MKKMVTFLIILLLPIMMTEPIMADELRIGGKINQTVQYDVDNKLLDITSTDFKIEFTKQLGFKEDIYLSLKGYYNFLDNKAEIELDEAYTSIYLDKSDIIVGRQIINWGTADGINPTNYINPQNIITLTNDGLLGEPVLAAQNTYYGNNYNLTGVLVFDFVPQDMSGLSQLVGTENNQQFTSQLNKLEQTISGINLDKQVPNKLKNIEYALKLEKRINGYDLKMSYFHGWQDNPAIKIDPINFTYSGQYRQVDKLGFAVTGAIKSVGIWAETSYNKPEKIDVATGELLMSINKPYIQAVVGSDYTFKNGFYLEGQYLYYENGSFFNPYNLNSNKVKPGKYLMGRVSRNFNQGDSMEFTAVTNLDDGSSMIMPAYIHDITPVTELKIRPILNLGENNEEFGMIPPKINISISTSF